MNTCPVGIATQDQELRKLFTGDPDHVVNFFRFLAEDLRELMASLGFRTITEMVGRNDLLRVRQDIENWKVKKLDISPLLFRESTSDDVGLFKQIDQDFELEKVLDWKLVSLAEPALKWGEQVFGKFPIANTDRSVGALLSNEISKLYKGNGLPDGSIQVQFKIFCLKRKKPKIISAQLSVTLGYCTRRGRGLFPTGHANA